MLNKFVALLKKGPFFLWLLPVFFVLHGCMEHYDYVPLKDAALLTGTYLVVATGIAALAWLLFRNFTKACLAAASIMAFHFFFGAGYDFLQKIGNGLFFTRYTFILPAALIGFIVLFYLIKKRNSGFSRTCYYLNVLLLIFILVDAAQLAIKASKPTSVSGLPEGFVSCNDCPNPDIYFILADEYAGQSELVTLFGFDNSAFLNNLRQKGFHIIPESYSNYNYTPFSMASILNMDYLPLAAGDRNQADLTRAYSLISNNRLLQFLEQQGYRFYNYSVFDFEGQPGRRLEGFLPVKTRLITSQTFLSRAENSIFFNLVTRFRSKAALRKVTYAPRENNEHIYALTRAIAAQKSSRPRFVYTHLEWPHYPYYYDSAGREQPFEKLTEGNQQNQQAYTSYLQYANKRLLELITHIQQVSARPAIIVLMGDHGFRHFTAAVEKKYYFNNLSAIYYPDRNYRQLPDSLTSVNLFRLLLNQQFRQQLPMARDSMIYLKD